MTNTANNIPEELRELSQSALVVMFYDQAMTALEDAIDAIDEGDIERRFNAVKVGTGLISQLALSLDDQSGGEIAHNLGSIYDFILGATAADQHQERSGPGPRRQSSSCARSGTPGPNSTAASRPARSTVTRRPRHSPATPRRRRRTARLPKADNKNKNQ